MDPTRKDGGVPIAADLQSVLARAKDAVEKQKEAFIEMHVRYNMATGEIEMAAPTDPFMFYGVLELMRDTFQAQQARLRAQNERRIAVPPGALSDEQRPT